MQTLTISELERAAGVPRSTIYFYVRAGLLPEAQKAAASRGIYSDVHVELLAEIRGLRDEGLALDAIRTRLQPRIEANEANGVDLVARQAEAQRRAILEAATRQFATKGYKRTRIGDIVDEVGVTPPVLYEHFATKRQLFAEAIALFVDWTARSMEPQLRREPDRTLRELARVGAFFGVQALSPDFLALARSEAMHEGGEAREAMRGFMIQIASGPTDDLGETRQEYGTSPPVIDELVSFGVFGALENMTVRASLDEMYSRRDVLRAQLFIYLAVQAVYRGEVDLSDEMEDYAEVVDRIARSEPPVPPEVQRPHE
jgi:AcrR family transcriptional regulator